jgi:archaellin
VVDSISFQVSPAAGGDSIPLDPAATTNRTVIAYRDKTTVNDDMTYTVTWITGNSDNLLDPGELATITVSASGANNASTISNLAANDRWTLEVQTPVGAVVDITRSLPAQLNAVMQLH